MLQHYILISVLFFLNSSNIEYDIVEIYKVITPDDGTIVLTTFNDVEEAELILVPMNIDPGNYSVRVTRKAKDLYSIDGYNIFIKTRFCQEFFVNTDVQLKISSFTGETKGKILIK